MLNKQHELPLADSTTENLNTGIEAVFKSNEQSIYIEMKEGKPVFLAKDVCDILSIANSRDAVNSLDEDQKLVSVVTTSGQRREMNFVTESGLYALIFQSRKPEAKKFQKWVTDEVLPSIRRTGGYNAKGKLQLAPGANPFSHIFNYAHKIQHNGKTWYAAIQVRTLMGKPARHGGLRHLFEAMQAQGIAMLLPEDALSQKWYVTIEGIPQVLNIKPTNFVNIHLLEMIKKEGKND